MPYSFPLSQHDLETQHNCFKLRHFFTLASETSQLDFTLIARFLKHLISCQWALVSENLREGMEHGISL